MDLMKKKVVLFALVVWSLIAILLFFVGYEAGEARWTATLLMSFLGFPSTLVIPRWLAPVMSDLNISWFRSDSSVTEFFFSWLFFYFCWDFSNGLFYQHSYFDFIKV